MTMDTHGHASSVMVIFSEFSMTMNTFALIRYHDSFNIIIFTGFLFFTLYSSQGVRLNVCLAARLTEVSKFSGGSSPFWLPEKYISIYRRGRPFKVTLGNSFGISKGTFPFIMNDIVIDSVINLLITF